MPGPEAPAELSQPAVDRMVADALAAFAAAGSSAEGAVPASKVVTLNGKSVQTAAGVPVKIKVAGGNVFLNGSTKVIKTGVMASNGIIHVINKVLIPR